MNRAAPFRADTKSGIATTKSFGSGMAPAAQFSASRAAPCESRSTEIRWTAVLSVPTVSLVDSYLPNTFEFHHDIDCCARQIAQRKYVDAICPYMALPACLVASHQRQALYLDVVRLHSKAQMMVRCVLALFLERLLSPLPGKGARTDLQHRGLARGGRDEEIARDSLRCGEPKRGSAVLVCRERNEPRHLRIRHNRCGIPRFNESGEAGRADFAVRLPTGLLAAMQLRIASAAA